MCAFVDIALPPSRSIRISAHSRSSEMENQNRILQSELAVCRETLAKLMGSPRSLLSPHSSLPTLILFSTKHTLEETKGKHESTLNELNTLRTQLGRSFYLLPILYFLVACVLISCVHTPSSATTDSAMITAELSHLRQSNNDLRESLASFKLLHSGTVESNAKLESELKQTQERVISLAAEGQRSFLFLFFECPKLSHFNISHQIAILIG